MLIILFSIVVIVVVLKIKKRKEDVVFEALTLLALNSNKSSLKCEECKYFLIEGTHNGIFGTCVKSKDKFNRKSTNNCCLNLGEENA